MRRQPRTNDPPVRELADWLGQPDRATETTRFILSLGEGTQPLAQALGPGAATTLGGVSERA